MSFHLYTLTVQLLLEQTWTPTFESVPFQLDYYKDVYGAGKEGQEGTDDVYYGVQTTHAIDNKAN